MEIRAIILAAGQGKRLRPLTDNLPKCLIKIGRFPILYYQLKAMEKNNISNIILVIGYMSKKVIDFALKKFPKINFTFVYNDNINTNTLHSLALAAEKINNNERVLLLNGDVFFDQEIIKKLKETNLEKSCISIISKKCGREEIKVVISKDGSIDKLNKKINADESIGEAVGINMLSGNFWIELRKNLKELDNKFFNEYFEFAIEKTISKNKKIYPFILGKLKAIEIDCPSDLKEAKILSKKNKNI